jgi:hypothetical protein
MKLFKKEKFAFQYDKTTPEEYERVWKGKFYKSLSYFLKASNFWLFVLCIFYIFKNF